MVTVSGVAMVCFISSVEQHGIQGCTKLRDGSHTVSGSEFHRVAPEIAELLCRSCRYGVSCYCSMCTELHVIVDEMGRLG